MQSNDDTTQVGGGASSMLTPGQMLKVAREQKNLSHADVAKQLRLSSTLVADIERNRFTDVSALIYVHGYLRSYAKLVNIDPVEVLEAFKRMKFDEPFLTRKGQTVSLEQPLAAAQTAMPFYKTNFNRHISKKVAMIGGSAVGLTILLATFFWLHTDRGATTGRNDVVQASPANTEQKSAAAAPVTPGTTDLALPKMDDQTAAAVERQAQPTNSVVLPAPAQQAKQPAIAPAKSNEHLPPVEELPGTDVHE